MLFSTQAKEPWDYDSLEERLADATRIKEKGTKYFKEAKYDLARKLYQRGSELITDTQLRKEEQKEAAKPLRVAFHLNLAACHLKLSDPKKAISECDDVCEATPSLIFLIDSNEIINGWLTAGSWKR